MHVRGHVDGASVQYYRRSERSHAPGTPFDIRAVDALPRVDVSYGYADADGTAVRAFRAAGAQGIVSAGLAPGMTPPRLTDFAGPVHTRRTASSRTVRVLRHFVHTINTLYDGDLHLSNRPNRM